MNTTLMVLAWGNLVVGSFLLGVFLAAPFNFGLLVISIENLAIA
jgi:hypothetical protein